MNLCIAIICKFVFIVIVQVVTGTRSTLKTLMSLVRLSSCKKFKLNIEE
jgi:hypothetical protein